MATIFRKLSSSEWTAMGRIRFWMRPIWGSLIESSPFGIQRKRFFLRSGSLSVKLFADGVCVFRNATRRRTVAAVSAVSFFERNNLMCIFSSPLQMFFRPFTIHLPTLDHFPTAFSHCWYARTLYGVSWRYFSQWVWTLVTGIQFSRYTPEVLLDNVTPRW